jgi:hypothetical protein
MLKLLFGSLSFDNINLLAHTEQNHTFHSVQVHVTQIEALFNIWATLVLLSDNKQLRRDANLTVVMGTRSYCINGTN